MFACTLSLLTQCCCLFCVWYDIFKYVPWLIQMGDMTHSYVQHGFVIWSLIRDCAMTDSYVCHDLRSFPLLIMNPCVCYGSFICVTWQIHMCKWHHNPCPTFTRVSWHLNLQHHSAGRAMWRIYVWIYASWLIHICAMTQLYVRHEWFICATSQCRTCDVTHLRTKICLMTHLHTCHGPILCVPWMICMCNITMWDVLANCACDISVSICLSVCLSVYPSVCLSVCLLVCVSVRLSVHLSVALPVCVCLSVCPSVPVSVSMLMSVSVSVSVSVSYVCVFYVCACACACACMYVCVSVCLCVCVSVSISVYACVYLCTYVCVCVCVRACVCICVRWPLKGCSSWKRFQIPSSKRCFKIHFSQD